MPSLRSPVFRPEETTQQATEKLRFDLPPVERGYARSLVTRQALSLREIRRPFSGWASKISFFSSLPAHEKTGVFHHRRRSQLLRLSVSPQLMATAVNFDLRRSFRLRDVANLHHPWFVGLLFAALMAGQALGFLFLGTGRAGLGLALSILVLDNLLALACAWTAFRRAQGITALFWFLFVVVLVLLLVPTVFQTYDTLFDQPIVSASTWRLLYCLYGAPILMMLFLPETYRRVRVEAELILDFFQVAIVVALIYSTFFFLPVERMLPADALLHNLSVSNAQSLLLLIAAVVRLQFARVPSTRNLFLRLALFLLVCAVATFIGDWIDLHHYVSAAAWFNLGWALPYAVAGLIALTWAHSPEPEFIPEPPNFLSFLGTNLVLVAMLSCIALLMDRWKQAHGELLADVAIGASLLAFTFRLALTQFHQHQEIAQRKAAQDQLTVSHQKVGLLLDNAQRQTAEITQISELGSLLQVCTSREEVFRLIPDRLRRLFPGASGSIALLSVSKSHAQSVAQWGVCPADQIFAPEQCWALRRGRANAHPGGDSAPRCSHLLGEGPSVCIPLIANGDTFGTLAIQNDDPLFPISDPDDGSDVFARRLQLAATAAEHIAVAVANLNLRESLRV